MAGKNSKKKEEKKSKKKPKIRIRRRRARRVKKEIKHKYIPKHEVVPEDEEPELLEKLHIKKEQLPLIAIRDPGMRHLEVEKNNIIKITRTNPILGETNYYRRVIRLR